MNVEVNELVQALHGQGFIASPDFARQVLLCMNTKPVGGSFLYGKPGTGKSFLPQILAKIFGAESVFYQCFPGTREDDLLVKLLPDDGTKAGIKAYDGPVLKAAQVSQAQKVFLILDEWDKTRPSADSFLLDFLQHGRISFANQHLNANMENLMVWVTMNDERDLSEPLLRRLPKLDFKPLHPALVKNALEMTHQGHSHLNNAVLLYMRCLMAEMPKPATIQELRQLLDAITVCGESCDWNTLVYQFVTKTVENHKLLKAQEGKPIDLDNVLKEAEEMKLNTKSFEGSVDISTNIDLSTSFMPGLAKIRGIDDKIDCDLDGADLTKEFGVIKHTVEAYNKLAKITPKPHKKASRLLPDGRAEVTKKSTILIHKPFLLGEVMEEWFTHLWGLDGEVVIIDKAVGVESMFVLNQRGMVITKLSQDEIVGKFRGLDIRWTLNQGLEAVVHLKCEDEFHMVFQDLTEKAHIRAYLSKCGYKYVNNTKKKPTGVCLSSVSWDTYTSSMQTSFAGHVTNVPGMKDFIEAEAPEVTKDAGWTLYHVPGLLLGFYGQDRGHFGLRIFSSFDRKYIQYIRALVPSGAIPLHLEETVKLDPEFLQEYGFKPDSKNNDLYQMADGNTKLLYTISSTRLSITTSLPKEWSDDELMKAVETTECHVKNFFSAIEG